MHTLAHTHTNTGIVSLHRLDRIHLFISCRRVGREKQTLQFFFFPSLHWGAAQVGGSANERHHSRRWHLFIEMHNAIKWCLLDEALAAVQIREIWREREKQSTALSLLHYSIYILTCVRLQLNWGIFESFNSWLTCSPQCFLNHRSLCPHWHSASVREQQCARYPGAGLAGCFQDWKETREYSGLR